MWVVDRGVYRGQIDSWDRGVQFGDGVFETILILDDKPQNFERHINRLVESLSRLSISNKESDLSLHISNTLADIISKSELHSGVLKVLVTRGDSARGYAVPKGLTSNITFFYNPLPVIDCNLYQIGVDLKFCSTQCSINPQLSGMKHLNRLENVLARQELDTEYEGLMQNHLGNVVEGIMSNIFFERESVLYTPKLDLSGVKGVMRGTIFELCEKSNIDVQVIDIKSDDMNVFQSAFICNSVIGILPVKSIDKRVLNVGTITKQLQTLMDKRRYNE